MLFSIKKTLNNRNAQLRNAAERWPWRGIEWVSEWVREERMWALLRESVFPTEVEVSAPVTTNFALTHFIPWVHVGSVFKGNWNSIHSCETTGEMKKKKTFLNRASAVCFLISYWNMIWPDACSSNLLEDRWTWGWMRHKRDSLFWLRQTPFLFTTIQPLSYSKPLGPTGQS